MIRAITVAALFVVWPGTASGQELGVLHIKVTLKDAAGLSMPVPRYALLISDNPSTSEPRRVLTAPDGTADLKLLPGSYTVESDEPVTWDGKGYQWTRIVQITATREAVLELTAENAEVGAQPPPSLAAGPTESAGSNSVSLLLPQWKDSVVAVWTPTARASGFVVDAAGLVVTNQRAIGSASTVEVQLTPSVKVAARVLASDRQRDVAVVWIDPAAIASVRPVPLNCASGSKPPFAAGQDIVALGAPLRGQKDLSFGQVVRVDPRPAAVDLRLPAGSAGGPVFDTNGNIVGLSSLVDAEDERGRRDARIVPVDDTCEVVRSAEKARSTAERPAATPLPVEPPVRSSADALDAAVGRRAGDLSPYQMSSSEFDIAFLTPVLVYAAQHNARQTRVGLVSTGRAGIEQRMATDFGGWSDYFADVPAVLVVRVMPKLAESFWATIARGAAMTQGVALPAIQHFKPGFSRLRAFCGDVEVIPIHPFILEQRVSERDAIRQGLYVFDPQSLGPHCKTVKLMLYTEKEPGKPETRPVDTKVLTRIWADFARLQEDPARKP